MRQFLKGCLLGEGGFSGMSHVPLKIIAAPKYPHSVYFSYLRLKKISRNCMKGPKEVFQDK